MLSYILRRLLLMFPTLIGVTVTAETAAWFADGQNTGNCELIDSASVRFV